MSERKVREEMRRVNAFIDGTGPEPTAMDLKCAALDSVNDLYDALNAGDREARHGRLTAFATLRT